MIESACYKGKNKFVFADTLDYYSLCICCHKGPSFPFYENADYYGFTMSCYKVLTSALGRLCQNRRLPKNLLLLPQNSIKSFSVSLHRFIHKCKSQYMVGLLVQGQVCCQGQFVNDNQGQIL